MDSRPPDHPARYPIQDFIFGRELSEIYLLLDHISGRADKSFAGAHPRPVGTDAKDEIEEICRIGWPWPPRPEPDQQARDSAQLIRAKDWLNAAARPATGATIAFTLMVVGDDFDDRSRRRASWLRQLMRRWLPNWTSTALASARAAPQSVTNGEPGWPTRLSLARTAFPGLVRSARQFERKMHKMMAFLVAGLIATCLLSWYVAFGNSILIHLDSIHQARNDAQEQLLAMCEAQPAASGKTAEFDCVDCLAREECLKLDPRLAVRVRKLQDALGRAQLDHVAVSRASHTWATPLSMFTGWGSGTVAHASERSREEMTSADFSVEETDETRLDEEVLRLWTHVLAGSVLPIFYGCLGAAVAVVRELWAKVKSSTLSPRDFTLAIGQLGLGVTIGACISLFYPSAVSEAGKLADSRVLTAAAVSFLAGFGVEAVFSTMETIVRRIFNTPGPATR